MHAAVAWKIELLVSRTTPASSGSMANGISLKRRVGELWISDNPYTADPEDSFNQKLIPTKRSLKRSLLSSRLGVLFL